MKLLVVDDAETTERLRFLLATAGHAVRTANTARDAMVVAEAFPPDVAMIGLGVADLGGHAIARRLRARSPVHTVALAHSLRAPSALGMEFDQRATTPMSMPQLYRVLDVAREALRRAG